MPYLLKNIHSNISNSNMHHSKRRLFNIKQQKISANQPVFLHVCLSTLVFCSVHHQRVVLCQTTSHCLKMKSLELLCANKLRKNVIASSDFNRFMVWISQVVPFMALSYNFLFLLNSTCLWEASRIFLRHFCKKIKYNFFTMYNGNQVESFI